MVYKAELSTPLPTVSVPTFVFKSPYEPLPSHPFVINVDDANRPSFSVQEYRLLSQRVAQGLRAQGLQDGDRVLLACENSLYFPVMFMGTIMAGGIFVGVNKSNSSFDLIRNIRQTNPTVILLAEDSTNRIGDIIDAVDYPRDRIFSFDNNLEPGQHRSHDDHWSNLLSDPVTAKDFQWSDRMTRDAANQTATLIYSSGTSGNLKAVEISHFQILANVIQGGLYQRAQMGAEALASISSKPAVAYMAMAQALGQIQVCVAYAYARMPMYITAKRDYASIQDHVINLQSPMLIMYPTFLVALMKDEAMRKKVSQMKALRVMMLTGGPVSDSLCMQFLQFWKATTGQELSIRIGYGQTELVGGVYTYVVGDTKSTITRDLVTNGEMKVVSLTSDEELGEGQEGEICLRSPAVATGYWQEPDRTAATFLKDGWVKTGDIGLITNDQKLVVRGRKKDLIGIPGSQITPLALEEILLSHTDINQAVVCPILSRSDPDNRVARAYVVRKKSSTLDNTAVIDFMGLKAPHLPGLEGGVSFPQSIPVVSNQKPEREVLVARDAELNQALQT